MMAGRSVRINVSIPEELLDSLNQQALPRNRIRLICESLRHYILQKKNAELKRKPKGHERLYENAPSLTVETS